MARPKKITVENVSIEKVSEVSSIKPMEKSVTIPKEIKTNKQIINVYLEDGKESYAELNGKPWIGLIDFISHPQGRAIIKETILKPDQKFQVSQEVDPHTGKLVEKRYVI